LENIYVGEQEFKGRDVNYKNSTIPMHFLLQQEKTNQLVISKKGKGRLYYRIGINSASKETKLKAENYGFTVFREYVGIKDKEDVKRDQDGTYRIKNGTEIQVNLKMIATSRRYHVALIDKCPAGLEPSRKLGRNLSIQNYCDFYGSSNQWFEHQNLRSERVEAMATLLPEGIYYYSYTAKAIFKGVFQVPCAYAEEIFSPEMYGRTESNVVIIE